MSARTPTEIHALFKEAFNCGDIEALVALYEPNAVLIYRNQLVVGQELIRAAYRSMASRQGRMEVQTRSVIESPDGLAVLHAAWKLDWPSADGGTRTASGVSTEVVRRQPDGAWLFVIDEPSTPLP